MDFSSQLTKVLDDLGKRFGVAIDWTQQNITPYVKNLGHRISMYEIYTSIAWIVLALLFIIFAIILIRLDLKNDTEIRGFLTCVASIFIIVSIIIIGVQTVDIIRAITIPEAVWIDYIQQYISK